MKWRFEERGCPICGESHHRTVHLGRRGGSAHHLGLGVETGIVRCRCCHAVYPKPMLIPEGNPYLEHSPENYFEQHDSHSRVLAGERLAGEAEQLLGSRGRMLEIGCGRGELLRGAANQGWLVGGVDLTEPYAAIAREQFGVNVEVASAERSQALHEQWDVVLLAAVLEHIYEPAVLIGRVAKALRPGGLIFLDVPNECSLYTYIGNLYLRLSRRGWAVNLSPTFAPYHVVGFCPRSLRRLLMEADLTVTSLKQYRMNNAFDPSCAGLRGSIEKKGVEAVLTVGRVLGMAAGLICWARKA